MAAGGAMGTNVSSMLALQQHLVRAITWYNHAAGVVAEKKQQIALYVNEAQDAILQLRGATGVDPEERDDAIEGLIASINAVNRSIVSTAAAWITPFADWQAPADALEQLLARCRRHPRRQLSPRRTAERTSLQGGFTGNPRMRVEARP